MYCFVGYVNVTRKEERKGMKNCEICNKEEAKYHISVRLLQEEIIGTKRYSYQGQSKYGNEVLKVNVGEKCMAYKNVKEVIIVKMVEERKRLEE
jgi:hypothetical protein